jgi:hypothetical protein
LCLQLLLLLLLQQQALRLSLPLQQRTLPLTSAPSGCGWTTAAAAVAPRVVQHIPRVLLLLQLQQQLLELPAVAPPSSSRIPMQRKLAAVRLRAETNSSSSS